LYLPFEFFERLVDGHNRFGCAFFGTDYVAASPDRNLCSGAVWTDSVVERTQFQLGVNDAINNTVQPAGAPDDVLAKIVCYWDAITANLKVHLPAPFIVGVRETRDVIVPARTTSSPED
jgi:hypothetical protein